MSATLRLRSVAELHCNGGQRTAGFYFSSCCSPSPYKENFPHSGFLLVPLHPLGGAHADNDCALSRGTSCMKTNPNTLKVINKGLNKLNHIAHYIYVMLLMILII